jgi:hypothetical protein
MAIRIEDDFMSAEYDGHVIATARGTASTRRLMARARGSCLADLTACSPRNQAITAMVLAERLAAGCGDDDLFVIGWREELGL